MSKRDENQNQQKLKKAKSSPSMQSKRDSIKLVERTKLSLDNNVDKATNSIFELATLFISSSDFYTQDNSQSSIDLDDESLSVQEKIDHLKRILTNNFCAKSIGSVKSSPDLRETNKSDYRLNADKSRNKRQNTDLISKPEPKPVKEPMVSLDTHTICLIGKNEKATCLKCGKSCTSTEESIIFYHDSEDGMTEEEHIFHVDCFTSMMIDCEIRCPKCQRMLYKLD